MLYFEVSNVISARPTDENKWKWRCLWCMVECFWQEKT